ncbi:ankyrin [Periconia macrospinosa]|uniref:Ankyrin n=1 Tax=Periconia macrospinosa TaxID=97972 RepID=A0A2V1E5F2_9PLEO|nr:ankyrin [Periconia macrospinosa]
MTKDWDAVQAEIKDLSFVQKKRLDEVKRVMEVKYGFKASTRAYRMKLAEWGITRQARNKGPSSEKSRKKGVKRRRTDAGLDHDGGDDSDSTAGGTPEEERRNGRTSALSSNEKNDDYRDKESLETILLGRATVIGGPTNPLDPAFKPMHPIQEPIVITADDPDPWASRDAKSREVVMDMLATVLDGDSQKLEALLLEHPDHLNLPIGMPFDIPDGRFYNHPSMFETVTLQHEHQTLLDIACGLPSGPVVWVLLSYNARGSRHPFGTDLALHNAIKNGRTYTVQSLLMPNKARMNGSSDTSWKPFLQAVFWNHPHVVRCLIDKGVDIHVASPSIDGVELNALQYCLDRRCGDYMRNCNRDNSEKILKMLLDAGADINPPASAGLRPPTFDVFITPWQNNPNWIATLNPVEIECLEAFIRKGADSQTNFRGITCSAPSGHTFQHQMLWHSTPDIARLIIDHADPGPSGNGNSLLHEIVGSCPDAKRHPSETLRDIEVLLRRGADPNHCDSSGLTPLRRCIDLCPAVDIVSRLELLLSSGADPELKHANRLPPYVLAARNFEDPLRSQLMDLLVAKIRGRQHRTVYDDTFVWAADYFPIPSAPTWTQVQCYNGQDGAFNANLADMVPEDIRAIFQRAVFSVASLNFLNTATANVKANYPLSISPREKDDIFQAILQRQMASLPEYQFDQAFVLGLLKPQMAPLVANIDPAIGSAPRIITYRDNDIMLPHQTPILSLAPPPQSQPQQQQPPPPPPSSSSTAPIIITTTSIPPPTHPLYSPPSHIPHPSSPSPPSSPSSSFPFPSTTQLRWPRIGSRTRHGDLKRAKDAVLSETCEECANGVLLTRKEAERHRVEHEHSRGCEAGGECGRRFCARRRGDGGEGVREGGGERGEREEGIGIAVERGAAREFRFSGAG